MASVWHTQGGDNRRLGRSNKDVTGTKLLHTITLESSVAASPVFQSDGTAFLCSGENVRAIAPDGSPIWSQAISGVIQATPALDELGNRLFAATNAGFVHALNAENGEITWGQSIVEDKDPRILSDLLFLTKQNIVIASSWQETYYGLDAETGEKVVEWPAGAYPQAGASAALDETVYCMRVEYSWDREKSPGVRLVKINPYSGDETSVFFQPNFKTGDRSMWAVSAPVIDEDRKRIFCVSNIRRSGILHCVSMETGYELWKTRYGRQINGEPGVAYDGTVFLGDMLGNVTAYDMDGRAKSIYETGALFVQCGVVVDNEGTAFFGDNEGVIHRLDREGNEESFYEASRAIVGRPAIDPAGRLWVPSMDGNVYVFGEE